MASQLVVVERPFAEDAVLDWVRFRIAEGVDDFHVVVTGGPGAEERLALMVRRVRRSGATASGEVSAGRLERVVRTQLRSRPFTGMIVAAGRRPSAPLARRVGKLQARYRTGVVWVVPQATVSRPDRGAPVPAGAGDVEAAVRSGSRTGATAA